MSAFSGPFFLAVSASGASVGWNFGPEPGGFGANMREIAFPCAAAGGVGIPDVIAFEPVPRQPAPEARSDATARAFQHLPSMAPFLET